MGFPSANKHTISSCLPGLFIFFVLGAAGIALVLFAGEGLSGTDGYYHIKFAHLTRQQGLIRDFVWTQQSLFRTHFSDKEFLFHVFLIPFTFGDLIWGAKLAVCVLVGAIFALFYANLRSLSLRFPAIWTLLLLCSGPVFIYRLAQPRPHLLSILLLLLATHCFHGRRYWFLFALSVVYALSYSAAHLILILAILFNFGLAMGREKFDWRLILHAAAGVLLGLIIHPNVPNNFRLLYVQSFLVPLHAWGIGEFPQDQTIELLPASGRGLITCVTTATLLFFGSIFIYLYRGQRPSARTWTFLSISTFFFVLTILSIRFVEYWIPFTLLLGASAVTDWCHGLDLDDWMKKHSRASLAIPVALLLYAECTAAQSILIPQNIVPEDGDPSFGEAALWLANNIPPGETVFHSDWGDFTQLFFYAPEHRYLLGLDPVFMFVHDSAAWRLWKEIGEGKRRDFSEVIRERFHARYVFLQHANRPAFDRQLSRSSKARQLYRNSVVAIYELL